MVSGILPLRLDAVELIRGGTRILGPVSLTLRGEGITIVLGPNGAGKTSLLRAMHGLERVSRGRVGWAVPLGEARRAQAFVFQAPVLMRRSVAECIAYPLRLDGLARRAALARAAELAGRVGLGGKLDLPSRALSGGEKQKLALARALIRQPEVLLLDEPCANLDGRATRDIEAVLLAARAAGTRVVMSTHNVAQARRLADDVLFLYHGRLHESGLSPAVFDSPGTPELSAFLKGDLLP